MDVGLRVRVIGLVWRGNRRVGGIKLHWSSDTLSPVARSHCPARRDELRVVAVFISANDGCRGVVRLVRMPT